VVRPALFTFIDEEVSMARWLISRSAGGHLELDYQRPGTLGVFKAGRIHAHTNILHVLKWIVDQDATTTGDLVILPDRVLLILPQSPWRV
jgi:hypothetical protein